MERKEAFYRVIRSNMETKPYAKLDMGYKAVHVCSMDELKEQGIQERANKLLPNGIVCYYVHEGNCWIAIEELTGLSLMTKADIRTFKEAYAYVERVKYSAFKVISSIERERENSFYKLAYCSMKLIEDTKNNGNK